MPVISNQNQQLVPVELTRQLLAFNTVNPPGNEADVARFLAHHLENSGFKVQQIAMRGQRSNVIAEYFGNTSELPIVLSGHLDTVPLGSTRWEHDAFAGEIHGGAIYGRGSSDMKAGIAAIICAATKFAAADTPRRTIRLVLTAGEETGCLGARHLQEISALGNASAVLIAEPTSNYPAVGHKGALFARCHTTGVTAHSSMPEQGENAIYKAARAIGKLEQFSFDCPPHKLLGKPTLNVGMVSGGLNVNSVPDHAEFTIDVRSVAGMNHDNVLRELGDLLGDDITVEPFVDLAPVATNCNEPFVASVFSIMESILQTKIVPRALPFFTDGCVFSKAYQCPIVILGPGEPEMAHKTDEFCRISKIEEAVDAYTRILDKWCR